MPWEKPADGARRAVSSSSSISAGSIGSVVNSRVIRRRRMSASSGARSLAQRLPSLTRSSAITQPWAIERATLGDGDVGEQRGDLRLDLLRLQRLVVEEAALALGLDDERLLVVLAVDAEALGQAATPGPLLADGAVAGAGDQLVDAA